MKWVELTIRTTTQGADAMAEVLFEAGVNGVSIEDRADVEDQRMRKGEWDYIDEDIHADHGTEVYVIGYLPMEFSVYKRTYDIMDKAARVAEQRGDDFDPGNGEVLVRMVEEEDWADNWKQYYKPIEVGKDLVIKPFWEQYSGGRGTVIIIDPGMAFGTGQHETTTMCLEMGELYCTKGAKVLDVGCGTGILGLSAALLGAKSVLCIDSDDVALASVQHNAELNECTDIIKWQKGNLVDGVRGTYDLIFGNIVADAVVAMLPRVKRLLTRNGIFVTSGIIREREEDVLKASSDAGMVLKRRTERGEWLALALGRK